MIVTCGLTLEVEGSCGFVDTANIPAVGFVGEDSFELGVVVECHSYSIEDVPMPMYGDNHVTGVRASIPL